VTSMRRLLGATMMLRVDTINLPPAAPIGEVSVAGLAASDLIIVSGPNGAGKSVLTRPLKSPGLAGNVECVDQSGARQQYQAQGVNQSIAFVRSTQLMSGFRDLEGALALAANATADLHRERLLTQLSNTDLLRAGAVEAAQAEPGTIRMQREAYFAADRQCGQRPRTIDEYRRLGQDLAAIRGVAWAAGAMADADRLPNELLLQPELRTMQGLAQVRPAIDAICRAIEEPTAGQATGAARLTTATAELESSIADAVRELRIATVATATLDERAAAVRAAIDGAIRAAEDAIAAIDLLRDCRERAARYIRDRIGAGATCDACPVCEQPVDGSRLQGTIEAQLGGESQEASRWRATVKRLEEFRKSLQARVAAYGDAQRAAHHEHDLMRTAITRSAPNLRAAEGWAPSAVECADRVRIGCEQWLKRHAIAPSEDAVRDAQALRATAESAIVQLDRESARLNDGLPQAQQRFQAFQRLGSLFAIRAALDATEWTVSLDQVDAERRRAEQRDRWRKVLRSLAAESQARADAASSTVVDDPGVQERFRRLLARLAASQPALAGLAFRGSSVTAGGEDRSAALSEGQTVLANIAAVIAVVGKVCGSAAHRPGWIVFDEPTNGLDEENRDAVADYLGGITTQDLPGQIVVTTFDRPFADRLINEARRNGRRIRHIELPAFVPGRPVQPIDRVA
jgi:ABC-type transport system involved in cytochrome c biogenesis ATPase subunit